MIKVNDPKNFFEEAQYGIESFAKEDRSFDCRRCAAHFKPAQDQWIFYRLCDRCFVRFDDQKMRGRFISVGMQADDGKPTFESVEDWIAADLRASDQQ